MKLPNSIHILPEVKNVRRTTIKYETYEYIYDGEEVRDVNFKYTNEVEIPELDYLTWIELCLAMKKHKVKFNHYYMKNILPYDKERPDHHWDYFTNIKENRLYQKDGVIFRSEMLLYYLKDFNYYIMICLESHRGRLTSISA